MNTGDTSTEYAGRLPAAFAIAREEPVDPLPYNQGNLAEWVCPDVLVPVTVNGEGPASAMHVDSRWVSDSGGGRLSESRLTGHRRKRDDLDIKAKSNLRRDFSERFAWPPIS